MNRGAVLYETLFLSVVLLGLLIGMHGALIKFWNHKLETLQSQRSRYDGVEEWVLPPNF